MTPSTVPSLDKAHRAPAILLGFAIVFPSLLTFLYYDLLAGSPQWLQQAVYVFGKALQFGAPLVWYLLWMRRRRDQRSWRGPRWLDLAGGFLIGMLVAGAGLALVGLVLEPRGLLDGAREAALERAHGFGVGTPQAFLVLAVFYSAVHAFFEEAYWRGFVFAQLRARVRTLPAIALSALAFMAHHVVVLAGFFGPASIMTWLLSAAVAFGGAVWAWHYARTGSVWGPWLGHAIVDAAIFAIGYRWVVGSVS